MILRYQWPLGTCGDVSMEGLDERHSHGQVMKLCIWCIPGHGLDAMIAACDTAFVHLACSDDLTVASLEYEIWISILGFPLVKMLGLRCILTHTLDAVLSTTLLRICLRCEDDFAVPRLQSEIIFSTLLRLEQFKFSQTPSF